MTSEVHLYELSRNNYKATNAVFPVSKGDIQNAALNAQFSFFGDKK